MTTVQDGQHNQHGRGRRSHRAQALHAQIALRGMSGVDQPRLGRLLLSPRDLAGLSADRELIDGAGQVGSRRGDLGLDLVRGQRGW